MMRDEHGERGAALLAVLLLVAVMAVIAASALDRLMLATRIAGSAATVDQGRAYAAALVRAGVAVTFQEARGTIHNFATLRKAIPSGVQDLAAFLLALRAMIVEADSARANGQ